MICLAGSWPSLRWSNTSFNSCVESLKYVPHEYVPALAAIVLKSGTGGFLTLGLQEQHKLIILYALDTNKELVAVLFLVLCEDQTVVKFETGLTREKNLIEDLLLIYRS